MYDGTVSSLFPYFVLIFFVINIQGKEHKMKKNVPLLTMLVILLYVMEMCTNFLFSFSSILFFICLFSLTTEVNNANY